MRKYNVSCLFKFWIIFAGFVTNLKSTSAEPINHELQVCNHSKEQIIYASIGYFDESAQSMMQKGWFTIPKDQCIVVLNQEKGPFYGYAESHDGKKTWGKGRSFCLHKKEQFTYKESNCQALKKDSSLVESVDFSKLHVLDNDGSFKWDIVE